MKKLDIAKKATATIVSLGVGVLVTNAVKATTPADIKTVSKVLVSVGGFVLAGALGDLAANNALKQIDDTAADIRSTVDEFKNLVSEDPTE